MRLSNSPGKLVLPFASSGNKNAIPVNSQIGITPGAASLADGFPPLTMTPVAAGGVPPSGLDMNGILYEMSAIVRWANAGGGYPYDADFATSADVGGYPKGARVLRADGSGYWFNTLDGNETDPDSGAAAGWVPDFASGVSVVTMGSANVTLTPSQYAKPIIIVDGTLTSNLNLIFPTFPQSWVVIDRTAGGYSVTAKTAAGVGVAIEPLNQIVCDGLNIKSLGLFVQLGFGATERRPIDKMREVVSIKDFGAKADGVTDDTAALRLAIRSGYSLDWGGVGDVYRVKGKISEAVEHAINWQSHGAKIVQTAASPVEVTLSLSVGALNHRIDGLLEIDANMKSFVGFRIQKMTAGTTYPTDYANFQADGLVVKNVYRASLAFNVSADGIAIRGPFDSVVLDNPIVRNSVLATGTGVYQEYGCYGITITENAYGQSQSVQINNPLIDSVYCEDPDFFFDQDGLRFITSANAVNPTEPTLRINGGTFRDCSGRSIKTQAENSVIDGTRFTRRTAGFSRGYGNDEIDFQEGGGRAVNIQCAYIGHVPEHVVNFSSTRQTSKVNVPFGSIDGAEVIIGTGLTLEKVVKNDIWSNITSQVIRVSNVQVRGAGSLTYFAEFLGENSGTGFHLLLSDNAAAPTNEWVFCPSVTGTGTIKADRQINTGGSAINFRRANFATWRPIVSARDCIGFIEATNSSNATHTQGVLERVGSLAGLGDGGTVRTLSFTLADGASQLLPIGGGNANTGLVLVSTAGAQRSGLFTRDPTGVYALAAGTDFIAGTTTEPATGSHRIWYSTADSAHVIKNASGGSRAYTVALLG